MLFELPASVCKWNKLIKIEIPSIPAKRAFQPHSCSAEHCAVYSEASSFHQCELKPTFSGSPEETLTKHGTSQ